jgi:Ca-activated chloride channel family protein
MQPAATRALAVPTPLLASSPIALGLPRDAVTVLAATLPANRPPRLTDLLALARDPAGWGTLATGQQSWGPVKFSTSDPGTTTLGASLVVAAVAGLTGVQPADLGASNFARVDARDNLLGFTRTLISAPPTAQALMERAQAAPTTAALLRTVGIVAVHEQDVWAYDGGRPAVPLQAVYPVGGQLAADYPFVVPAAPWVTAPAKAAAADLRDWLRSPTTQDGLDAYGLRRADGRPGPELDDAHGVQRATLAPEPAKAPDGYAGAQAAWTLITRPTSTLTVLDVSGSMAERVPGTAASRLDLARAAGIATLEFAGPKDSLGLWEFATRIDGARDYRQLVPLGPATARFGPFPDRRAAAVHAYRSLRALSDTGLYDTVLAAYDNARTRYRADAVNTMVVISDGVNDDPGGMTESQLIDRLRARYDPRRPVHIVTLAYGAAADRRALGHIASVTHGLQFAAVDPRSLSDVFIAAVTAYRLSGHR